MKHGPPFIAGKNPAFFGPKNSNMTAFLIYHKFDLPVMETLCEEKRVMKCIEVLGFESNICDSGFVDTTNGAVLSSSMALQLFRLKMAADQDKKAAKDLKACESAQKAAR